MLDYGTNDPHDATGLHDYDFYVWFNVNGAQTQPTPNAVNSSHLKNQILHQFSGQVSLATTLSTTVLPPANHVYRVEIFLPKWAQQINDGDTIELVCQQNNSTANWSLKFKAIYKEIFP